jgi:D-3-phosphoglycerate dehydrogenase / 2-oxoglutarate reductase
MSVLIMQELPAVAVDWLRAQGEELFLAYADDGWRAAADRIRALIYYSIPIDKPLMDALPALEIIGKRGAGIDSIDLHEASARGLRITNVGAGGNADSVAEHALMLLLAATRSLVTRDAATRQGRFSERFDMPVVNEITGSRVGIVGAGHIGTRVAAICANAFQCEIGFYDPYVDDESARQRGGARFDSVAALFGWADSGVVAAPRTPESEGMIGAAELAALGPEGVLVIVSRGGIVNESALVEALRRNTIRAAATDVYATEPPPRDHPFFELDNIILTPHVAGASAAARDRTSLMVCQQVHALLHGREAPLVDAQPWLHAG